jgi:hypothetical protein
MANYYEIAKQCKSFSRHEYVFNAAAEALTIQHEGQPLFNLIQKNFTERNLSDNQIQNALYELEVYGKIPECKYLQNINEFGLMLTAGFEILHLAKQQL